MHRRPKLLADVSLVSQSVRTARWVQMHVTGGYALADHHILCEVVVGRVRSNEVVSRRVVVETNPANAAEERVEYGLMDVALQRRDLHIAAGSALQNGRYVGVDLVLYIERHDRIIVGNATQYLSDDGVKPADLYDVLGAQVADLLVEFKLV